jgi:hypothetical protein
MLTFRPHLPALVIAALASVLGMVTLSACGGNSDYRPRASGQEGVVTVLIDSTLWNADVGEALQEEVGQWVGTLPTPERLFDLRQVDLTSQQVLENAKAQKNVIVAAPLQDTTGVARFVRSVLTEEAQENVREQGGVVIRRPDLWRREQMVIYVTAGTPEELAATIREQGDVMRQAFTQVTRVRTEREMFEKGRQPEVEERIMDDKGYAVNVQHDYLVAIDSTYQNTNFLWLRRILSDTWRSMWIYTVDNASPSLLTPEWIYATHDSLTRQYLQGEVAGFARIDRRRPLETENIDFKGRFGYETRGLWRMVGDVGEDGRLPEYGMGGPFLAYAFYDQEQNRVYLMSGSVFAPSYDKREFLRQLEVIAYTLRTAQDEAGGDAVASAE